MRWFRQTLRSNRVFILTVLAVNIFYMVEGARFVEARQIRLQEEERHLQELSAVFGIPMEKLRGDGESVLKPIKKLVVDGVGSAVEAGFGHLQKIVRQRKDRAVSHLSQTQTRVGELVDGLEVAAGGAIGSAEDVELVATLVDAANVDEALAAAALSVDAESSVRAECAQRIVILLSALLCFSMPVRAGEAGGTGEERGRDAIAAWVTDSPDLRTLGSGQILWPDVGEIESFFPLGFSEDGWFAHSNRAEGLLLDYPLGMCRGEVPCFEVSVFNVLCDNPCAGDVIRSAGVKCKCFHGVLVRHLEELGIRPQEDLRFGEFPAYFGDIEYDIELTFREKAIFSELWQETRKPELPETRVFLVADGKKRKLVGAIDHNHSGIGIGVRVAGWLEHPESGRIIVLLLVQRAWTDLYALYPLAAELGR